MQLQDSVVLITGGGGGLGRAIVRRFVAEGACFGVLERSPEGIASLRAEFSPDRVQVIPGDVRDSAANARAVAETVDRFGKLDIFIGNAGIYDNRARFADLTAEQLSAGFDELFSVNVKGYLLGARAALGPLRASQGGIIFTSSVSGIHAGFGGALYVASKHAIVGLTRQLAWELAPHVRVNAVAPGYIPTDLAGLRALGQGKASSGPAAGKLPLSVIASADDYTGCYVLLASKAGSRIATGMVMLADGGLSVAGPGFPGWPET